MLGEPDLWAAASVSTTQPSRASRCQEEVNTDQATAAQGTGIWTLENYSDTSTSHWPGMGWKTLSTLYGNTSGSGTWQWPENWRRVKLIIMASDNTKHQWSEEARMRYDANILYCIYTITKMTHVGVVYNIHIINDDPQWKHKSKDVIKLIHIVIFLLVIPF